MADRGAQLTTMVADLRRDLLEAGRQRQQLQRELVALTDRAKELAAEATGVLTISEISERLYVTRQTIYDWNDRASD